MARRGFFAELQHQLKQAEKSRAGDEREGERQRKQLIAEAKRAQAAAERVAKQVARAEANDLKRLTKEHHEAHLAVMAAEVDTRNLELSQLYDEIDSLLAATLDVDDYVDLDKLRRTTEHPPFNRTDLEPPLPIPEPPTKPKRPSLLLPPEPTGIHALFGRRKHEQVCAYAYTSHQVVLETLKADYLTARHAYRVACKRRETAEPERVATLTVERDRYTKECAIRQAETVEHNEAIDSLLANLGYGAVDAVEEYISIVLSNSVYPEHFPIKHEFEFNPASAELHLFVFVPTPDTISTVKAFKYTKSSDEITSTPLSKKSCKDRYTSALNQVALRSLHEVFEADRRGIIKTISLEVGTKTSDPATGQLGFRVFVAVGAERESFLNLNLSDVDPPATLEYLGAAVSKNPFELVVANTSGIRRS